MNRNGVIIEANRKGFLLGSRTIITATGASTYTVPTNCKTILIECIGGGGGGQPTSNSTAGNIRLGNGGQAGGYSVSNLILVTFNTLAAVVNAGGASNASGGVTSLSQGSVSLCTAQGGQCALNGNADGSTEIFITPSSIAQGTAVGAFTASGAPNFPLGHRVSGTVVLSAKGAPGPFGGQPISRNSHGVGTDGGLYGGGGAGGVSVNAGGGTVAGAGGQGLIIVWEFY